ncbi:hypothetical protein GGS21DRAFT_258295 [Xylaria nigripes]|nr:hypothetical protein GGS21DRAFT_258295 [Xylaria nigripes]
MKTQNHRTAQNVCSDSCPIYHIKSEADKIQKPSASWPDIRGLNSLNYSRTAWLAGDAIEVSLSTYKSGLPQRLQDKIDIMIPGVDPKLWSSGEAGKRALFMTVVHPPRRLFARMRKTEYSILPICTDNNHWILAVVHKEKREEPSQPGKMQYSYIAQIAVMDPLHDDTRINMVHRQLEEWFGKSGSFKIGSNTKRKVWVPTQNDTNSCGPRAYWNGKQIIDRLLELHESGIGHRERLWNPLSGWFNEHFVRGEMIGRCAWNGVRAMDYRARVSIECVNLVRNPQRARVRWEKANEVMEPPDNTSATPQKRPRPSKGTGAAPDGSYRMNSAILRPPPQVEQYLDALPSTREDPDETSPPPLEPPVPVPNQPKLAPNPQPAAKSNLSGTHVDDKAQTSKGPAWPTSDPDRNKRATSNRRRATTAQPRAEKKKVIIDLDELTEVKTPSEERKAAPPKTTSSNKERAPASPSGRKKVSDDNKQATSSKRSTAARPTSGKPGTSSSSSNIQANFVMLPDTSAALSQGTTWPLLNPGRSPFLPPNSMFMARRKRPREEFDISTIELPGPKRRSKPSNSSSAF